jgi:polyphosphate kinase
MPRNLYNRVELVTPVTDETLKDELADTLDRAFADNTGAWELHSDGSYRALAPAEGEAPHSAQASLLASICG